MTISSPPIDEPIRCPVLEQTPVPYAGPLSVETTPSIRLLGARLHALTERQCVRLVLAALDTGRGGSIITLNVDRLRRFVSEPAYAACFTDATLVTADGMPLVWASHLQGTPLPERVTGSNLIWSLSAGAAERNRSLFLVGGSPGVVETTARVLTTRYPRLRIAGALCPPFGFERQPDQLADLIAQVTSAGPDIIYVALGVVKEERLISLLRERLPGAWVVGVGISFSFVAGEIPRAPLWMQQVGLEWAHRLVHEPRRLAKRYLVQGLPFALTLFAHALRRRFERQTW